MPYDLPTFAQGQQPHFNASNLNKYTAAIQDLDSRATDVGIPVISTVSALKSQTGFANGRAYYLLGYYAPGDGGHGEVYFDSSAPASSENDGSIIKPNSVSSGATGRYRRVETEHLNVEAFGMAISQSASGNRSRLATAAAVLPSTTFYLSRGDYPLDNSSALVLSGMSGGLIFSNGSRLVYNTNTLQGITLADGLWGLRIEGFRSVYTTTPTFQNLSEGGGALNINSCVRPVIKDTYIYGSPRVGLFMSFCISPHIENTYIDNTWADGSQLANNSNIFLDTYESWETGDDGLAFLNYASYADNGGVIASNIVTQRSDTGGISIAGQHDVELSNFYISQTNGIGLYVSADTTYDLRVPYNVNITHGTIKGSGTYQRPSGWGYLGNGYGFRVYSQQTGSPPAMDLNVDDVEIENPVDLGVLAEQNTGTALLSRVRVRGGANTTGGNGGTFAVTAPTAELNDCRVEASTGSGFAPHDCDVLIMRNCHAKNTSLTNAARRAFSIDAFTKSMRVYGDNLLISDDQATPTGYVFESFAQSGFTVTGDCGIVRWRFNSAIPGAHQGVSTGLTYRREYIQGTQSSVQSAAPTSGQWAAGDYVYNPAPTELGTAPNKYVVLGWLCVASGAPGTWVQRRALTGN